MQVCTGLIAQCALFHLYCTRYALIKTYIFFLHSKFPILLLLKNYRTHACRDTNVENIFRKVGVVLVYTSSHVGYATVCAHSTFPFVRFIFLYLKHKQHIHVYKHVRVHGLNAR